MSGGSFDYASDAADLASVLAKWEDLTPLADYLALYDCAGQALIDTKQLLDDIARFQEAVEERITRLQPVWHGIEWYASCDWSHDQFRKVCETYNTAGTNHSNNKRKAQR